MLIRCWVMALATACVVVAQSSFSRAALRWNLTVRSLNDARLPRNFSRSGPFQAVELPRRDENLRIGVMALMRSTWLCR